MCLAPTCLVGEPDPRGGPIRQERIPELRRQSVAFPEIGRRQVHGFGRDHRERLFPGGRRLGQPLRNRVGPTSGKRCLNGPREPIGFDVLERQDGDQIDQVSYTGVFLGARERVGLDNAASMSRLTSRRC